MGFGFLFSKTLFEYGCGYRQAGRERFVLASVLVGQAKLAILKMGKNEGCEMALTAMFRSLVELRIVVEHFFGRSLSIDRQLGSVSGKMGCREINSHH